MVGPVPDNYCAMINNNMYYNFNCTCIFYIICETRQQIAFKKRSHIVHRSLCAPFALCVHSSFNVHKPSPNSVQLALTVQVGKYNVSGTVCIRFISFVCLLQRALKKPYTLKNAFNLDRNKKINKRSFVNEKKRTLNINFENMIRYPYANVFNGKPSNNIKGVWDSHQSN